MEIKIKSGTEKQIDFARDIFAEPLKQWDGWIEVAGRGLHPRTKEIEAYERLKKTYMELLINAGNARGGFDAGWVIDHRVTFGEAANALMEREAKKTGLSLQRVIIKERRAW